jgi:hypothetical protein
MNHPRRITGFHFNDIDDRCNLLIRSLSLPQSSCHILKAQTRAAVMQYEIRISRLSWATDLDEFKNSAQLFFHFCRGRF